MSIHYGRFLASKTYMRLVAPPPPPELPTVRVHKMEEKGSDVNLATYMLTDAFDNDSEVSVLVTNDSDLALPVRMLAERFDRPVGLVNPNLSSGASQALLKEGPAFIRQIRSGVLGVSQFPDPVVFGARRLHKPASW